MTQTCPRRKDITQTRLESLGVETSSSVLALPKVIRNIPKVPTQTLRDQKERVVFLSVLNHATDGNTPPTLPSNAARRHSGD